MSKKFDVSGMEITCPCESCQECGCNPEVCRCECHTLDDPQMKLWEDGCEVR